jgi:hypothetical protein
MKLNWHGRAPIRTQRILPVLTLLPMAAFASEGEAIFLAVLTTFVAIPLGFTLITGFVNVWIARHSGGAKISPLRFLLLKLLETIIGISFLSLWYLKAGPGILFIIFHVATCYFINSKIFAHVSNRQRLARRLTIVQVIIGLLILLLFCAQPGGISDTPRMLFEYLFKY